MHNDLYTEQGAALGSTPWDVYPRPQLRWNSYVNLNGIWELTVLGQPEAFYIYSHCYEQMTELCAEMIGADICLRMGNVYFYGIGTEKNDALALKFYQEAEQYFYRKISNGDYFAKKGLEEVIEKQNEIRKRLFAALPSFDWT